MRITNVYLKRKEMGEWFKLHAESGICLINTRQASSILLCSTSRVVDFILNGELKAWRVYQPNLKASCERDLFGCYDSVWKAPYYYVSMAEVVAFAREMAENTPPSTCHRGGVLKGPF